jgi:hypothetical protein
MEFHFDILPLSGGLPLQGNSVHLIKLTETASLVERAAGMYIVDTDMNEDTMIRWETNIAEFLRHAVAGLPLCDTGLGSPSSTLLRPSSPNPQTTKVTHVIYANQKPPYYFDVKQVDNEHVNGPTVALLTLIQDPVATLLMQRDVDQSCTRFYLADSSYAPDYNPYKEDDEDQTRGGKRRPRPTKPTPTPWSPWALLCRIVKALTRARSGDLPQHADRDGSLVRCQAATKSQEGSPNNLLRQLLEELETSPKRTKTEDDNDLMNMVQQS